LLPLVLRTGLSACTGGCWVNQFKTSGFPVLMAIALLCSACSQELATQSAERSSSAAAASGGSSGGASGGSSSPVASKPRCNISFASNNIILGVDSLSFSWTSSLSAGMVGQTNVVSNASGEVIAIHREAVANFGVGPGSKMVDPKTVAFWVTAFLINNPTITIAFEPHESTNGADWQSCNAPAAQLKVSRRSLSLGTCEVPVGVEQTTCGGAGTKVFFGGVCQVLSSSANANLNQKFFECADSGTGTKQWQEVSVTI
jgi:hypothetical protein